jgi:AICAR transformylase/IMP cyclohydrolase PurH
MREFLLKYGCNPNQQPARVFMAEGDLPFKILGGRPGYINLMDALNSWQLVSELKAATGLPSAASFKHVSPSGAAVGEPLSDELLSSFFLERRGLSPLASAYARARGTDRLCSYGDWAALSDICDEDTAQLLRNEVSDGVIAPGYTRGALEILAQKRGGNYNIVEISPDFIPPEIEQRNIFGVCFEQSRNDLEINGSMLENIVTQSKDLPEGARRDLIISLITLKYTQSNSVCFVKGGQTIGVGAGQQSRVHCTRLAGSKADNFFLRQHPKTQNLPWRDEVPRAVRDNAVDVYISASPESVLSDGKWQGLFTRRPEVLTPSEAREWLDTVDGVSLGSDAFFPFEDNIERAKQSGVKYIAQPGGSIRDGEVIKACDDFGMVMAFTGIRLFHH